LVKPRKASRTKLRTILGLLPWLATVGIVALLWRVDSAATAGLFQSSLPTPAEWATPTSDVATAAPTLAAPVLTATVPQMEMSPTATWTAEPEPTLDVPVTPTAAPTASPKPAPATGFPEGPGEDARYPEEQAGLRFGWRTLVDALALGVSYLWLACGIALFVLLVLLLLWLLLRGRRSTSGH